MKKTLKIVISLLIILGIGVGAAFALKNYEPYNLQSIQKDPAAQLEKSFLKTQQALEDGLAFTIPDVVTNISTAGALDLTLITPDKQKIINTLYLREEGSALIGSAEDAQAQKLAEYGIWLSNEAAIVTAPVLLGDNSYGINFQTLEKDLETSDLLKLLGITTKDARQLLDAFTSMTKKETEQGSDLKALLKTKKQLESLLKACPVSVDKYPIVLNTESVEAFHIAYTLTPERLCEALDMVAKWATETESYAAALTETPALEQELKAALDDVKKNIADSNATTMLEVFLHPDTQVIMQANCRIDWLQGSEPASVDISITLGVDPIHSTLYSVNLTTKVPDTNKQEIKLEYRRSHAHNLPGRTLVLTTPDESATLMDLQVNALTGSFVLKLMDRDYALSGKCVSDDNSVAITITERTLGELTITFKAKATVPSAPRYISIFAMSEDELTKLIEKMREVIPSPEPDPTGWKEADISITNNEMHMTFNYLTHSYDTLGQLLIEEGIAVLDENGCITKICDEDFAGIYWEIYLDGELVEGNLYDCLLDTIASISILEGSPY